MPRAIQQFLPPTPVKKATLLPPKPNHVAQRRERAEDFRQALKTARQSNDQTSQPQPKATKAEAKKVAGKSESKTTGKTKQKSQSSETEPHDQLDETSQEQQHATTEITSEAQTQAQETEEDSVPEDKADTTHDAQAHHEHPEQDAVPADAVAAQLIHPVDRAKDDHQPKRSKDETPENASGVDASHPEASPDTATTTNATASPAFPVQNTVNQPVTKRPKDDADDAHPSSSATEVSQNALAQQAASAAQSATGANAANPKPVDPTASSSNQPSTQPRPVTPIVSALGAQPAPIQPPTAGASAADRATSPSNVDLPADPSISAQDVSDLPEDVTADDAPAHKDTDPLDIDLDPTAQLATDPLHHPGDTPAQAAKLPDAPAPPPEVDFAQTNHDRIVTGVHSQLLPHGGTMEIRLDPPELGALKVMVEMRDGVMNATFQTSNEQATQLLSHSLNQLKHVLETQGVSVERIQVQQAPKSEQSPHGDHQQQQQQQQHNMSDDHAARQEQQRKEMMRRMWRRVSGAGDPIDYMA